MPKGVEHPILLMDRYAAGQVINSVMPKGVEHDKTGSLAA